MNLRGPLRAWSCYRGRSSYWVTANVRVERHALVRPFSNALLAALRGNLIGDQYRISLHKKYHGNVCGLLGYCISFGQWMAARQQFIEAFFPNDHSLCFN